MARFNIRKIFAIFSLTSLPIHAKCRLLALLGCLFAIKAVMLFGLRKYLFEIHYRVGGEPQNWFNYLAFYALVILSAACLYCFTRRSTPWLEGMASLRVANGVFLGLGLAFIFLTFHHNDVDAFFTLTIKEGFALAWHDIRINSLDKPPFLAYWLLSYALSYALLVFSRRENAVILLTVAYGCVYAVINLNWLRDYKYELLAVNGFGLAYIVAGPRVGKNESCLWLMLPLGWTLVTYIVFRHVQPLNVPEDMPFFEMLVLDTAFFFGAAIVISWLFEFNRTFAFILPFLVSAFWLLISTHFRPVLNFDKLLYLGVEISRYFIGEMFVLWLLSMCTGLYCSFMPKDRLWLLDIVGITLILAALVDLRLSQVMGVRLGWDVLTFEDSPTMVWRMVQPYLGILALIGMAAGTIYFLLVVGIEIWLINHPSVPGEARESGRLYVTAVWVILAFLGLTSAEPDKVEGFVLTKMVKECPLWQQMLQTPMNDAEFSRSTGELGLGDIGEPHYDVSVRHRRDLNVVLIFMESSYNKYLSLFDGQTNTEPLLAKYKNRMEIFPNYFTDFPGSIHARFAAFTSLYPVLDYDSFTLRHVPVKSIFDIMHENGYFCSMFYSSSYDYTGFRDFLRGRGLDEMYDMDTMPGPRSMPNVSWGLPEKETEEAICAEIRKMADSGNKFFLTYVPAAPHYPYDGVPQEFQKYKRNNSDYVSVYVNSMLYMDWVISTILDQLKDSKLFDNTLVVITDDHGEMLGENGGPIGHGWAVNPALSNIPLIIMDPEKPGYRLNYTVGSEVDLMPTILDKLGIPLPRDELYEGKSLYEATNLLVRLAYINSYSEYGIIKGHQIIEGDRDSDNQAPNAPQRFSCDITNSANETLFIHNHPCQDKYPLIHDFDKFQENLLRNYSFYQEMKTKKLNAAAVAAPKS